MAQLNRGRDERRDYHHFVPKLLLRHFSADDGCVTVYNRDSNWSLFRRSPDRIGEQKHLYSPEVGENTTGDPKDDTVERWLEREVDGPAGKPLRQLAEGARIDDLSTDEFYAMAGFVGMQDIRVPKSADLLVPAFAEAAEAGIMDTDTAFDALNSRGLKISREEIREFQREHRDDLVKLFAKPSWLDFLVENKGRATAHVAGKLWFLIDAPDESAFLTSDLAIIKFFRDFRYPCSHHFGDFEGRDHWLMPISPKRALALAPVWSRGAPLSTVAFVAAANRQLIKDARRFVYSRDAVDIEALTV
ncbi:MAG: DUF4238 domain-containing protein [Longimicrobiaceae bacterium]